MNFKKRVNGSWHDIPYYVHNTFTDTITTLPAVLYPTGTTATVGLKGNTVQSGTPTPDNPIMPEGCGERTGNLCPSSGWEAGQYANGVWDTVTPNRLTSPYFAIEEEKQYTIKINSGTKLSWINLNYFDSSKQWLGNRITLGMAQFSTASQSETTPNMPTGSAYMRVTVRPYNDVGNITINDIPTSDIAVNEGSTALPYEPYGYKLTISSASTTTPVYLGEVQTTRRVKKYEFTGQENIAFYSGSPSGIGAYYRISDMLSNARDIGVCSHFFPIYAPSQSYSDNITFGVSNNVVYFMFSTATISSLNLSDLPSIKTWLQQQYAAGTPVTVWYVLATEQTAVVNEPLMRIGNYADKISNISIPVTAGGDTLSVGTTVQPSEITANYKGWHPKTPKVSNNGSWT